MESPTIFWPGRATGRWPEFPERRWSEFSEPAYAFLGGQSAEAIAQAFPVLTLEQVYGAITYYLAHRAEVDQYLELRRQGFDAARQAARDADPMFYQKLAEAKRQTPLTR
jgi:hypothetical protein